MLEITNNYLPKGQYVSQKYQKTLEKRTDRYQFTHPSLPRILLMLELCMSGKACKILRLSSLAHTIKAFMGRFMWLLFLDSGKCREPAKKGSKKTSLN